MNCKQLNIINLSKKRSTIGWLTPTLTILCLCLAVSAYAQMHPRLPLAVTTANAAERKNASEIEYEVKAAFIYNFMKFVEWPKTKKDHPENKTNDTDPVTIGILGGNPFEKAFKPILNKKAGNRNIQLVEIESFDSFQKKYPKLPEAMQAYQRKYAQTFQKCEIIFISQTENSYVTELLKLLSGQAILTISDLPEFAEKGGIVGFVTDNKKVRFEINLDSAKHENIQIASQLLRLARRVYKK